MDYLGVDSIPEKHILKRWSKGARDVLPEHLKHYERTLGNNKDSTYRHSSLYILAMEVVRLGDTSAEAYEKCMNLLKEALATLGPYEKTRDGLGLEDKTNGNGKKRSEIEGEDSPEGSGTNGNPLSGLTAPCKKQRSGRPTTSREKAPYDGSWKSSRFCSICKKPGHKRTTCPGRGDIPKEPRKEGRCSHCGVTGHRRSTCSKPVCIEDIM
uniref:Uncharacterized protein n=1 Tax=Avena sativa TaxID=4498 RepID=A0ACD6A2L2_AVESA